MRSTPTTNQLTTPPGFQEGAEGLHDVDGGVQRHRVPPADQGQAQRQHHGWRGGAYYSHRWETLCFCSKVKPTFLDFGFMFESSPGGNMAFEPDMKLTTVRRVITTMCHYFPPGVCWYHGREDGGSCLQVVHGALCESLPCCEALQQLPYLPGPGNIWPVLSVLLDEPPLHQLMLDTGLPCFRGQTIEQLKQRLQQNASEKEAAEWVVNF